MEIEKSKQAAWWVLNPDAWDAGVPRRLHHRPVSIPEVERIRRTTPPPTEDAAVRNVKHAAIRNQSLLLRQLLSTDRWYNNFAPEYLPSVRFARIAAANGLTVAQVIRALQLAYELDADGLL